jgi:hypothetical protein
VLEVLAPRWDEIEKTFDAQNRRYLALAAADHDAIGRVLRTHLVVERFLGSFLQTFFGIDDVEAVRLSFSQKATLLPARSSSAAFVRPGILQFNVQRRC